MRTALIGHTGFVGSNLAAATDFDDRYNSRNLDDIAGREYDLVISAAGRADSHRINSVGEADWAELEAIVARLETAQIGKLVLISTVCVYPGGGSTPDEQTPIEPGGLAPYGANRARLETLLRDRFDTLVVRLPQLYGRNLKKGIVYDLLHDYRVEHIHPDIAFQYYDLGRLWTDVQRALELGLPSLNVATPPLRNREVAREVFGRALSVEDDAPRPQDWYTKDMRTVHAQAWGSPAPGYLMSRDDELAALEHFVTHTSD